MRIIGILVAVLVVLPGVLAVGVGIPDGWETEQEMDEGDSEEYIFLLRGDSAERDVNFFFNVNQTGIVTFNGNEQYSKNFNLEPYEDVEVEIRIKAIDGGVVGVTWGYKYLNSNSSDLSIEQVVTNYFTVDVDGFVESTNTDTSSTSSTTSSGGGGGGGGAYIVPEDGPAPGRKRESIDDEGISIEDISAQGSATSEMVASNEEALPTAQPVNLFGGSANEQQAIPGNEDGGKLSLLLTAVLFTFTAGLSFVSYKAIKGEEDE